MDNRLVLTVVFVTLSWMFMGSYAQNNMTTMATNMTASNNMTNATMTNATMATNMTASNNMTNATMTNATMATNMTASNNMTNATMATNMTASNNMTNATMATNMTASNNMTNATMATNMTASNNMTNATMATNMTASNNMTNATMATNMTAPNNMTNATMATNMTAPNNMTNATMATNMTTMSTVAPPLVPNITVVPLVQNISNSGCGSEQFCGSQPASCDPSVPGECFFVAAKQESGRNFGFSLSGESEGYLAATLSTDSQLGGNDTTYVCANNNGTIQFFSTFLNNGQLIPTELNVNNVKGRAIGRRIQCSFSATLPEQTARAENFAIGISTGPFNSSTGTLGSPNVQFRSPAANIANPNTTVTNVNNVNATMAPTTVAPPLEPNTTVVPLVQNISRSGCGSEQLCGSQPASCDPSVPGECFFIAAKRESGRNFGFSLSGESEGYLAATLSTDSQLGGNDSTYVCGNNNGTIQFFSTVLNNGQLIPAILRVNNVKGRAIGRRIQCTFSATLPEQTARAENFAIGISTGTLSSNGTLGSPNVQFRSPVVNIADPNTTVTNVNNVATTPAGTTPARTTSSSPAIALQQSLTQALLITVGVLSLALL